MSTSLRWQFDVQSQVGTVLTAETPAVAVAASPVALVDAGMIDVVISRARRAPRRRSRVLLHQDRAASLQEMLIVLPRESCDIPHINMKSAKSFHVIHGRMVLMVFSDDGKSVRAYRLTEKKEGDAFMIRLNEASWHTIIPCTPFVAFIETIIGPFTGNKFAPWAPADIESQAGQDFAAALRAIADKCDEEATPSANRNSR